MGLCLGSFVNALVWRLRKKKNWISERSVCTHCGHMLSALDLIPVFSYIFLRGKCRYCKKSIDDSPFTELSLGLAFTLSYYYWPYDFNVEGTLRFVIWLLALVLLASMFLYDFKWMILPDKLTRSLLFLGVLQLILLFIFNDIQVTSISAIILSMIVGGGVFHLIYEVSKGKYIGGGDVKLGYAFGLFLLDPLMSWMVIAVASLIGSLIAIIGIIFGKKTLQSKLPFGPMLILGLYITVLLGQRIWQGLNTLMLY